MAKYAETDDGLEMIEEMKFKRSLSPYQRKIYRKANSLIQRASKEKPDELDKLLDKELKGLFE